MTQWTHQTNSFSQAWEAARRLADHATSSSTRARLSWYDYHLILLETNTNAFSSMPVCIQVGKECLQCHTSMTSISVPSISFSLASTFLFSLPALLLLDTLGHAGKPLRRQGLEVPHVGHKLDLRAQISVVSVAQSTNTILFNTTLTCSFELLATLRNPVVNFSDRNRIAKRSLLVASSHC